MGHHLKLRGSTWYWRINVPPDLRSRLGYEQSRSTRTGDKRLAQRYAMKWTAEAKEHFDELRHGEVASRAEMVAVARRVLKDGLRNLKLEAGQALDALDAAVEAELGIWRGIIDPEYLSPDVETIHEHVNGRGAEKRGEKHKVLREQGVS